MLCRFPHKFAWKPKIQSRRLLARYCIYQIAKDLSRVLSKLVTYKQIKDFAQKPVHNSSFFPSTEDLQVLVPVTQIEDNKGVKRERERERESLHYILNNKVKKKKKEKKTATQEKKEKKKKINTTRRGDGA